LQSCVDLPCVECDWFVFRGQDVYDYPRVGYIIMDIFIELFMFNWVIHNIMGIGIVAHYCYVWFYFCWIKIGFTLNAETYGFRTFP
jgi:hypothetical protein